MHLLPSVQETEPEAREVLTKVLTALSASAKKLWIKPDCPCCPTSRISNQYLRRVVVMRAGVRDSLVQWIDEKAWRFKLILLLNTAVVGAILLMFGIRL
jgi:hypothetical protein